MTNSADPDQLASSELFAKAGHVVFSKRRAKIMFITFGNLPPFSTFFTTVAFIMTP